MAASVPCLPRDQCFLGSFCCSLGFSVCCGGGVCRGFSTCCCGGGFELRGSLRGSRGAAAPVVAGALAARLARLADRLEEAAQDLAVGIAGLGLLDLPAAVALVAV